MLYATTRNSNDIFTAYKTLYTRSAPDGGLYTPFRLTSLNREALLGLAQNSFTENVAQVLNQFFSTGLTAQEVAAAIGSAPVRLVSLSSRLVIVQCWQDVSGSLGEITQALDHKLRPDAQDEVPTSWVQIAVAVALLFGVFGALLRCDAHLLDNPVDVAVTTGDFSLPMAAWYGKKMGLPIANIICGCNANGGVWDLMHHGQLSTGDALVQTTTPDADWVVAPNLERLVSCTLGEQEVHRFLRCCQKGSLYTLEPEPLEALREGIYAGVISDSRVETLIPSVFSTNQYQLSPYSALAYGSLMDYRAKFQESRMAILIADRSPVSREAEASEAPEQQ